MRSCRYRLHLAGLLLVASLFVSFGFEGAAAPRFGSWSAPVNLGPLVNTEFAEFASHVAKNGLSLYFASNRPDGSFGGEDLWVSKRPTVDSPWSAPVNLGSAVNTGSNERSPALSRDGHYLVFATDRAGGLGALDLWISQRRHTHDDFGWEAPVNLGAVNSAATDAGPGFFENDDLGIPLLFLASSRPGGPGGLDIYMSALTAGGFQPPVLVSELNTTALDLTPTVRHDGLEIVFASSRPGGAGGQDLWVSVREAVDAPWSAPVNLGALVNSAGAENFPALSSDRESLYFSSFRPEGYGQSDLFVSSRAR